MRGFCFHHFRLLVHKFLQVSGQNAWSDCETAFFVSGWIVWGFVFEIPQFFHIFGASSGKFPYFWLENFWQGCQRWEKKQPKKHFLLFSSFAEFERKFWIWLKIFWQGRWHCFQVVQRNLLKKHDFSELSIDIFIKFGCSEKFFRGLGVKVSFFCRQFFSRFFH